MFTTTQKTFMICALFNIFCFTTKADLPVTKGNSSLQKNIRLNPLLPTELQLKAMSKEALNNLDQQIKTMPRDEAREKKYSVYSIKELKKIIDQMQNEFELKTKPLQQSLKSNDFQISTRDLETINDFSKEFTAATYVFIVKIRKEYLK